MLRKFVSKKEHGDNKQNVIPVMPLCVAVFSQTSIFFDKPVTEIKKWKLFWPNVSILFWCATYGICLYCV